MFKSFWTDDKVKISGTQVSCFTLQADYSTDKEMLCTFTRHRYTTVFIKGGGAVKLSPSLFFFLLFGKVKENKNMEYI